MEEIWITVNSHNITNYEISNFGRLRNTLTRHVLACKPDKSGYSMCRVSVNGRKMSIRLHRAVALNFIPNINPLYNQVNHIDGNKINNHISNLEWCDNSYNQKHAIALGLKVIKKGSSHSNFKGFINVYKEGVLIDTLCGNLHMISKGYSYKCVSRCVLGLRSTYKGLTFKRILNEK